MTATSELISRPAPLPRPEALRPNQGKVLTSWKEIAQYLGKGVRTVQRWERDFQLPVRRPAGPSRKRAILALTSDLDAWVALSCPRMVRGQAANGVAPAEGTLRDQIEYSRKLRTANRLLLNELNIALGALNHTVVNLRAMPSSYAEGRPPSWRSAS